MLQDPAPSPAAGHGFDQTEPALRRQRRVRRHRQPAGQHRLRHASWRGKGPLRCSGRVRTRLHLGRPKRREGETSGRWLGFDKSSAADSGRICRLSCPGPDPAGPEARGELPLPVSRRRSRCRGLRGRHGADLQPAERGEQHFLQRTQVRCHGDELRRSGRATRHRFQGNIDTINTRKLQWSHT